MSQPPARGVKAGIKADLQAIKDASQAGYVAGPGTTAWSHDFLNKKPWHPSNFKNQIRKYEAEQEVALRSKREEAAKAEFESEQRYLDTLAHLPSSEAEKYRQRQSVSWMYLKPPGLSAYEEKEQQQKAEAARPAEAAPRAKQAFVADACRPAASGSASASGRPFADSAPWDLNAKRKERSPPRGGFTWDDGNQQFVGAPEELVASAAPPAKSTDAAPRHKRRRQEKEAKASKRRKKDKDREQDKGGASHKESKRLRRALKLLLKEGVPVEQLVRADANCDELSGKRAESLSK